MIVVIGDVVGRLRGSDQVEPAGPAAVAAIAAAADGARVEIVTRVGDDAPGDAVVLALARSGVRHVATIRDAGRRTPVRQDTADLADPGVEPPPDTTTEADAPALDAADIGLALRYLSDYRVIVLVHPRDPAIVQEAASAAAWGGAHLIVATRPSDDRPGALPPGTLAITADQDAEGVGALLGRYAAAVDRGEELEAAYATLTGAPID